MLTLSMIIPILATGQQTIQLRFQPEVGKVYRYKMGMAMTMKMPPNLPGGGNMDMKTDMEMTMKAIASKGDVTTMETKTSKITFTLPPNSPMAAMQSTMEKSSKGATSRVDIDRQFHVRSIGVAGLSAGANGSAMIALQNMFFPSRPLKVGDT